MPGRPFRRRRQQLIRLRSEWAPRHLGVVPGKRPQRDGRFLFPGRLRSSDMSERVADPAYYYPQPYWAAGETDVMKNLLLFFDGVAILLPRYMSGCEAAADPVLAGPLREKGIMRVLQPETFVDQEVTEALITAVTELVTQGAFDNLERPKYGYAELSRPRMGWDADVELSEMITEELISRDLARPSEDGVSVPLHPAVRMTFLVLLAQLVRYAGRRAGLSLPRAQLTLYFRTSDRRWMYGAPRTILAACPGQQLAATDAGAPMPSWEIPVCPRPGRLRCRGRRMGARAGSGPAARPGWRSAARGCRPRAFPSPRRGRRPR